MGRNNGGTEPTIKYCCECDEWVKTFVEVDPDGDGHLTEMCKYCESNELLTSDEEIDKYTEEKDFVLNDDNAIF